MAITTVGGAAITPADGDGAITYSSSGAVYRSGGPATVLSRRRPFPYDMVIQGTPVILRPQENGLLIGRKLQTLAGVSPITYDYSSQPVYAERTYAFRRIRGGYGERVQRAPTPTRYYYATNADLSVGGLQIKGPLVHTVLPTSTGPIAWFLDAIDNNVTPPTEPPWVPFEAPPLATYAGAGRYILRRTDDTPAGWVVAYDLGQYDSGGGTMVDDQALKAVRFWPAGSGLGDELWVVCKSGKMVVHDGAAWAVGEQQAYSIAVLRDELWISTGRNTVRNCTGDPRHSANWNAAIIVGDQSQPITNLDVLDNTLYIFKENGVFTINPDTSVNDRFPSFRQQPRPRNGVNAAPWISRLWFGYGDGYYWMDNGGNLVPTGPNILVENNSEVNGEVMAFAGHASWFGYYGMWNEANGNSYLVKHGTWVNPDEATTANYQFSEVPNGALVVWTDKQILSLYVSDCAPGLNSRMYCGFADGSIGWFKLPYGTPNPAHADSGCEFTDQESWVYWPLHHAMFQADAKDYRGFSVFGPRIGPYNTIRVQYRIANVSGYGEMPPAQQAPWISLASDFTFSGERIELTPDAFGYAIEVRHALLSTNQSTPVLEGVALHEQVRPAFQLEWTWTVNARRFLARRDGVIDRRTPFDIREACIESAASIGPVEIVMPDEGIQAVSVVDYSEALAEVTKRYGPEWDVAMKGIQFRTITIYGTWDRVALYDWDVLASAYNWDDVLFL